MNMYERPRIKETEPQKSDSLSDFMNKVIVCESLSGNSITGVLTEYSKYELILVEMKDIKSKKPKKTVVFKHGLVSIKESE